MKSFPNTSTHDKQWESDLRPFHLESNASPTRIHAPKCLTLCDTCTCAVQVPHSVQYMHVCGTSASLCAIHAHVWYKCLTLCNTCTCVVQVPHSVRYMHVSGTSASLCAIHARVRYKCSLCAIHAHVRYKCSTLCDTCTCAVHVPHSVQYMHVCGTSASLCAIHAHVRYKCSTLCDICTCAVQVLHSVRYMHMCGTSLRYTLIPSVTWPSYLDKTISTTLCFLSLFMIGWKRVGDTQWLKHTYRL